VAKRRWVRVSNWRRAGWVRALAQGVTLGDAIRAICASYVRQVPVNQLGPRGCCAKRDGNGGRQNVDRAHRRRLL